MVKIPSHISAQLHTVRALDNPIITSHFQKINHSSPKSHRFAFFWTSTVKSGQKFPRNSAQIRLFFQTFRHKKLDNLTDLWYTVLNAMTESSMSQAAWQRANGWCEFAASGTEVAPKRCGGTQSKMALASNSQRSSPLRIESVRTLCGKSGGTACFHVLIWDREAFSFCSAWNCIYMI